MKPGKIWVVGGKSLKADVNIPWQKDIPNLANCDTLIIDLNTIPKELYDKIPYDEIRDYLLYSLMSQKEIYIILSSTFPSKMLPIIPILRQIKNCEIEEEDKWDDMPDETREYIKYVEYCSFYIYNFETLPFWIRINPRSSPAWNVLRYDFTNDINDYKGYYTYTLWNKAKQIIGRSIHITLLNNKPSAIFDTGNIHFLPPTTKIPTTDGIDVLVNSLVGAELKEDEPPWVLDVSLPKVKDMETEIANRIRTIEKINDEIQKIEEEKNNIKKHLRLLWTESTPLEIAVRDAFYTLGFDEIRPGRAKDLEDWVINFKSVEEPLHGVLEVTGSIKSTTMADIDQCHRWVTQYRVNEGKKVKGIFIPNQFRRSERHDSKRRSNFPKNQIEYAKDIGVCILPTIEIFRAVMEYFRNNKIDRNVIEKSILESDPICSLI